MLSRLFKGLIVVTGAFFLAACTSIPITSLYKLYKLDPFAIDPQQFRLIVRAHEAISIRKGNVTMALGFKAHDHSLTIDDTYIVEIERNGTLPTNVLDDKEPGEALTLMKLSQTDAQQLAESQRLLQPYIDEDDSGEGSFAINISDVCLIKPLPPGKSLLTVYLQSDIEDGFFVFLKNLDMRKKRKDVDSSLDDIALCADINA